MLKGYDQMIARQAFTLVVVDVQERLAAVMDERDRVVAAAARLARTAALCGAPIIVTRQYPRGLGSTLPELEEVLVELAQCGASVLGVDKMAFCCAAEPDFVEALRSTGRSQIVLCGMETHICIAQTALALIAEGYAVHVAADACCSREREAHDAALARMRHAEAVVTWSESVMYEAVGTAGTDEFKKLLEIVKA
ncbi:MAG: isochorismatase family protein [Clostridiales bacterium]|nr:isochorismatase family protein [Clostridiales bacterium]